ncbi:MAG: DsrE family protein [Bacillota bacterium]
MAFSNIEEVSDRHLHILWTNTDPDTSENMVMMYARNAMLNDWWDRVTVIIWGGTQKLIFENEAVMTKIRIARQSGVEFTACLSCAVNLGKLEALEAEGIEVIRWGEKLSLLMQNGKHVLTI